MYVLGIESSCDETAVALVERGERNVVITEQVKSQVPIHAKYGGVVPEIASRNHYEIIDYLTAKALAEANLTIREIDLISLTQGPGLIGPLLVGLSFAKGLAFANGIPLIGVDHIYSHIESAFIEHPDITYPLIALVVSGGHTTIFYQESKFVSQVVAKTRDDAVGEILDKIAKFFDLGYPGGPILDGLYKEGDSKKFKFTRPRMSDGSGDFSFSGYKTAVIRHPEAQHIETDSLVFKDLISSFLHSVVDYLLSKTAAAVEKYPVTSVIVAGGVSRNSLLRKRFQEEFSKKDVKLYLPSPQHCTDNAAMVAWRGYEKFVKYPELDYADFNLNVYSRALFRESKKHR
jgi:N6-L-threonylcarbamoyladenine synthase